MRSTDEQGRILPPWLARPQLPRGSIGWRMGYGEEHYNAFYKMFSRLSADERDAYARDYAEPEDWVGVYAVIAASPWVG